MVYIFIYNLVSEDWEEEMKRTTEQWAGGGVYIDKARALVADIVVRNLTCGRDNTQHTRVLHIFATGIKPP